MAPVVISKKNSQDEVAEERLKEIKEDPSIGLSEKELDKYLKNRGVNVE